MSRLKSNLFEPFLARFRSIRDFVISEWQSEHRGAWAAIGLAVLGAGSVCVLVEVGTSRSWIYPSQRYDVKEVYIGGLASHCPEAARAPSEVTIEACLPRLRLDDLTRVTIPTFDEIGVQAVNFVSHLKKSPATAHLTEHFAEGRFYVIGIEIPGSLGSRARPWLTPGRPMGGGGYRYTVFRRFT